MISLGGASSQHFLIQGGRVGSKGLFFLLSELFMPKSFSCVIPLFPRAKGRGHDYTAFSALVRAGGQGQDWVPKAWCNDYHLDMVDES